MCAETRKCQRSDRSGCHSERQTSCHSRPLWSARARGTVERLASARVPTRCGAAACLPQSKQNPTPDPERLPLHYVVRHVATTPDHILELTWTLRSSSGPLILLYAGRPTEGYTGHFANLIADIRPSHRKRRF